MQGVLIQRINWFRYRKIVGTGNQKPITSYPSFFFIDEGLTS